MNVSLRMVERAARIMKASPELIQDIKAGKIKLRAAERKLFGSDQTSWENTQRSLLRAVETLDRVELTPDKERWLLEVFFPRLEQAWKRKR
jgi:hypothetical protein